MQNSLETPQLPGGLDQDLSNLKPVHPFTTAQGDRSTELPDSIGPYLKYIAEDDRVYQVRANSQQLFEVEKQRPPQVPYPPPQPGLLRPAYRWLTLAAAGMAFSGLGALLLAPIAIYSAIQAQKRHLSPSDEQRAHLVVMLSALLMTIGAVLAYVFWLHVKG